MSASLWTPDGVRTVNTLTRAEGSVLRDMHVVAQRHNIELRCPRCNQSFRGANALTDADHAVVCGCRELRFPAR